MYGVVPKSIWNKLNPSDGNNLCSWAMRCLLIERDNRLILIDTGLGNKQDNKFFGHYFLHGEQSLIGSLHEKGFSPSDITDVILTHLHFDHCGGAIEWNAAKDGFRPVFKNATYWSSKSHWQCATQPNPREKASFLKENILPIEESGQLKFIEDALSGDFTGTEFLFSFGHTEAMVLPKMNYKGHEIINKHYIAVLEAMLKQGAYVGIATHDKALVDAAYGMISNMKLKRTDYEFQMLLGVRPDLRAKIVRDNHRLRVYVPFGHHWYRYSIRRFKENPQMAGYVFKAIFRRDRLN